MFSVVSAGGVIGSLNNGQSLQLSCFKYSRQFNDWRRIQADSSVEKTVIVQEESCRIQIHINPNIKTELPNYSYTAAQIQGQS